MSTNLKQLTNMDLRITTMKLEEKHKKKKIDNRL
jgi:hypothetical protein